MTRHRRALARPSVLLATALAIPLFGLASTSSAADVALHRPVQVHRMVDANGPIICCTGGGAG